MDFSQYKDFQANLIKDYGEYYKKYPSAFLLLDYLAQLRTHHEYVKESWVQDRDYLKVVDDLIKTSFMIALYGFYIKLVTCLISPNKNFITIHSSVENHKFLGLNQVLCQIAKKNKWNIIFQGSFSYFDLLDLILLRKISPYRFFISSKSKRMLSRFRTADKEVWFQLLGDKELMIRLDRLVKQDVIRTAKLVKKLGIDIFINTGDSSGNARVLIESSKYFDSKTISFAHGYFTEPTLIGVAPVRSDKLILWTEKQRLEMSNVLDRDQAEKLTYVGYPKKYLINEDKDKDTTALILMGIASGKTYLEEILKDQKLNSMFEKIIESLKVFSTSVILRIHPNERNREMTYINEFVKKTNVKLSEDDLYSEISRAQYILGTNSSTLVEAANSGKKVFLIEELIAPGTDFEGVSIIKAKDIHKIKKKNNALFDESLIGFNENEISKKLTDLISSL